MGLLFGNLYYAWQARSLATRLGRDDVCALPYGINLLPIFFYTFYVMLPAQQIALSNGASEEEANHLAWIAGILACLGSGIIELIGSFFVPLIRRVAPRAALLLPPPVPALASSTTLGARKPHSIAMRPPPPPPPPCW